MKKFAWIAAVLAALLLSYAGYARYQHDQFVKAIVPHVKSVSVRVANSARYEMSDDSAITYRELFEKLEADIEEIDQQLVTVQTMTTADHRNSIEPVVDYLESSQEFLRALLSKYRKQLAFSSATDWMISQLEDLNSATYYSYDFERKSYLEAVADANKASDEYKASIPELGQATARLKRSIERVGKIVPRDALLDTSMVETILRTNPAPVDSSALTGASESQS